jgi:molecular chaperone DnaK
MVKDAEIHADEDKKKREEVEIRNEADSLAFRATKALSEYKDKIPAEVAKDVQDHIDKVKAAIEKGDINAIRQAKEALESHMQHIGEAMAKGAQAHAGAAPGPQPGPQSTPPPQQEASDEPVIEDAEVEIIDGDNEKR